MLYQKGYMTQWLRCVGPKQANYVLCEAHFRSCGSHAGARSIVQKVARLGNMPELSTTCTNYTTTSMWTNKHLKPMTLLPMGNRHSGAISRGSRPCQVSNSLHRLFYKMGRSRAGSNNHRSKGIAVRLAQYCLSLRNSMNNHQRQREAVFQQPF